jgi:hypothetical protein
VLPSNNTNTVLFLPAEALANEPHLSTRKQQTFLRNTSVVGEYIFSSKIEFL